MKSIVMFMVLVFANGVGSEEKESGLPQLRIKEVIEVTKDSDMPPWGLFDFMQPVWSPDAKKLAFTRHGFNGFMSRMLMA